MKIFKWTKAVLCLSAVLLSAGLTACSDKNDDSDEEIVYGDVWGEVLRGDNMTLQFYPDHFAYYWEYTFDAVANPETGLVVEGEFPTARFLSYNVYDDDEQTSYCSRPYNVMDVDIKPEDGSANPFVEPNSSKPRKYTLYILPTDAPASITAGKKNIIWFDADVKKVCTILRYYIPEGNIQGGVGMPVVKGLDLKTGKLIATPERVLSGLRGEMEIPGAAFSYNANMVFFRAPFAFAYPNGPAEYCYCRNLLPEETVMFFNFKAPSYPKSPAEYGKTDMRYWSVCVGNEQTYTPLAISDYQTLIDDNGFANYVLADKNSKNYSRVKEIAKANGYNILEWDNKAWGDGVMILYRNMVFDENYAHSMRKLEPVGPGVNPMVNPAKYISVMALGSWGATGRCISFDDFIASDGKNPLRQVGN